MRYQANSALPPFRFRTRRGQLIDVRRATLEDAGLLAVLLGQLSERALQLCYLCLPSFADDTLWRRAACLAQAQSDGHTTFIATMRIDQRDEAIGIAELTCDGHDATIGEVAIIVRGDLQKQGIGSSLLWQLVYQAQRYGMTHLSARMAEENTAMLRLIRGLKLPYTAMTRRAEMRALVSLPIGNTRTRSGGPEGLPLSMICNTKPCSGISFRAGP